MADYLNIGTNIILPFDPRRTRLILGTLEYVAAEVIVSKIVRKLMRADTKGWLELGYIHALSMPFLGGAAAFVERNSGYRGTDSANKAVGVVTNVMDGAKGIPAVLIAQYIIQAFSKGFHVPWFNLKDLLITGATKAITRPVIGFIIQYLPTAAQVNLMVVEELVNRQRFASSLRSDKK